MKLITFTMDDTRAEEIGVLVDSEKSILRLQKASLCLTDKCEPAFNNMLSLIRSGFEGLDKASSLIDSCPEEAMISVNKIHFLAPIPQPEQLRDFWAFEGHASSGSEEKLPDEYYEIPVYYKGNRFSVSGHEDAVSWPEYSDVIDYELEMAIVIGKKGKNISREKARDHIFGYMVFNDFSARDMQLKEMKMWLGPAKGKDFDGANAFGPYLVTRDEITDPYNLEMIARVNGEEWSRGNTNMITHKFEDMIAHVSLSETIFPGEVFGSGTVTSGCGLELGKYLSRGDEIELEIEGIGILRNKIS